MQEKELVEAMKAARLHAINDFKVDEVPLPCAAGAQLLLKVGACGICGSDIPRIFELGTSKQKYPLTLGHEFAGTIAEVGPNGNPSLIGKKGTIFPCIPCRKCENCITGNYAMCLDYDYLGSRSDGGFAQYCLIPSQWHFVQSENDDTTLEELAMVEPATVAQHAIRKGGLTAGGSILILGAGPIGILAARWAELFGAQHILLADIVEEKVRFAQERGLQILNAGKENIRESIMTLTGGRLADIVVEGTGSSSGLNMAIDCARTFGRVVVLGNPHEDTVLELKQHSALLRKELTLCGVWNSYYAQLPFNEWAYTVKMLDERRLKLRDLVTHRTGLDGLPQLCRDIAQKKVTICKALYTAQLD